jgi:small subunit ribosomal protein S7
MVTRCGKKSRARTIVYKAIERASEKLGKGDPVEMLLTALENVQPKLEVKSRRVGGATYQVPIEISYERQQTLAFRWLIGLADVRKGVGMDEALALEIIDAHNNTGMAVRKREEMHKMAQANRAFAHLSW